MAISITEITFNNIVNIKVLFLLKIELINILTKAYSYSFTPYAGSILLNLTTGTIIEANVTIHMEPISKTIFLMSSKSMLSDDNNFVESILCIITADIMETKQYINKFKTISLIILMSEYPIVFLIIISFFLLIIQRFETIIQLIIQNTNNISENSLFIFAFL